MHLIWSILRLENWQGKAPFIFPTSSSLLSDVQHLLMHFPTNFVFSIEPSDKTLVQESLSSLGQLIYGRFSIGWKSTRTDRRQTLVRSSISTLPKDWMTIVSTRLNSQQFCSSSSLSIEWEGTFSDWTFSSFASDDLYTKRWSSNCVLLLRLLWFIAAIIVLNEQSEWTLQTM